MDNYDFVLDDSKPKKDGYKPSVLSELLDRPFPQRIRLKKDIPFFIEYDKPFKDTPKVWILRAGKKLNTSNTMIAILSLQEMVMFHTFQGLYWHDCPNLWRRSNNY